MAYSLSLGDLEVDLAEGFSFVIESEVWSCSVIVFVFCESTQRSEKSSPPTLGPTGRKKLFFFTLWCLKKESEILCLLQTAGSVGAPSARHAELQRWCVQRACSRFDEAKMDALHQLARKDDST